MPVARAWRIYFDRSQSSTVIGVKEVEFRATSGGADWTGAGTGAAIGSGSFNGSFLYGNAFDNGSAEWASPGSSANNINHWIGWDLGPNPSDWKDLAEISLRIRSSDPPNDPSQAPKYFRVECSNDLAIWERDWAVGPLSAWVNDETRVFTRPAKTNQPYWRMYSTASLQGQYFAFAELEFRTSLGGGQAATGGTAISGGYYNGAGDPRADHAPDKAFDGITTNNRWASDGIFPAWIGYQWGSGQTIVQAKAWARSEGVGEATQSPINVSLDASPDGIVWVVAAEWHTFPQWSPSSTWVLTVPEDDELTIDKIVTDALIGGLDTGITASKIAPELLVGSNDDRLSISKISAEALSGALPQRITFSKLSAEALSGALPQRITFSKLAVELLVQARRGQINGPVQIIAG